MKKIVFTFGRMNPPTIGHAKLVDKVQSVAKSEKADARVYLSHTQNSKKDPLSYKEKIRLAKKAFGAVMQESNSKTLIQILKELESDGYTDIVAVFGGDRIGEMETLIKKYNGKDYNFDSIKVVSAGERDADSTDPSIKKKKKHVTKVSEMSASAMRELAKENQIDDYEEDGKKYIGFRKGLPKKLQGDAERIAKAVVSNLSEETDLEEAERAPLSLAQRQARGRQMKRLAPKLARMRKLKAKRMADPDAIKKRAQKAAKNIIRKKIAGERGADYSSLSASEKITIDKMVAKKSAVIQKLAKKLIPKVKKAEQERLKQARSGSTNENFDAQFEEMYELIERNVAQDPDIKDKEGTQPKKYFKDLAPSTKDKRDAAFKKGKKASDDDEKAYKPAPGDAEAETKPSKYTKKYHQMFGDKNEATETDQAKSAIEREKERDAERHKAMLDRAKDEDQRDKEVEAKRKEAEKKAAQTQKEEFELTEDAKAALQKKADKSGISYSILKKVYDRGMAAWKTGHRPGATQQQWGYARVNSFITGGKTRTTADADLWRQHKGKSESVELEEARAKKAVAGGKVQKLITGFGMSYKGKKYDEIDFELVSIDNSSQIVTLKILHPREHIGDEVKVSFKTLRTGRFMATDTSKINEAVSPAQQAAIAISKKERGEKPKKENFEPHMMYDPKTGKGYKANKPEDHERMAKMGYTHEPPKKEIKEAPRWLKDMIGTKAAPKKYAKAKEILQSILDRKEKEAGGKKNMRHGVSYYAAQVAKQFTGVDARILAGLVEEGGAGEEGTDALVKKYKKDTPISEAVEYHKENGLSIKENIFRPHSDAYYAFFRECRRLYENGELEVTDAFDKTLMESDAGLVAMYEGVEVPLDIPLIEEEDKELNKPKRGGPKKFYVYVKDPNTGNIKKVTFGDTTGLKAKIDDPEARKSFAARHKCDMQKDKTKAAYWACRLPYYAKELGLEGGGSFFW